MTIIDDYSFGTGPTKNVTNLQQLGATFNPYGIAGTTVINQNWGRYQTFNSQNFVFTQDSLDLTATIPKGGGLYAGGINTGQICSKNTYVPNRTGHTVYATEVRMKVPSAQGMWAASWFYTQSPVPGQNDGSEIDNPEIFNMKWQNQFDWTGYQHGPGVGSTVYTIITNKYGVWIPGLNFAADYHNYQTVWTPDMVYKYVDGTLIFAQHFKWTAAGEAQLLVSLAVGSGDTTDLPGLQPTSTSAFPSKLKIDHVRVWAK